MNRTKRHRAAATDQCGCGAALPEGHTLTVCDSCLNNIIRDKLSTDEGMANFLDKLLGPGCWVYDASEDVWVSPNKKHTGEGRGFLVIKRGGDWFATVLPEATI
jgi:hypothetical protein